LLSVEILDSNKVKIVDNPQIKQNGQIQHYIYSITLDSIPDLDINTVFLPNIKDIKAKELIAKNRLNIKDKNAIIQIVDNPQIKQNGQIQHYIYSITLDSIPYINFVKRYIYISLFF